MASTGVGLGLPTPGTRTQQRGAPGAFGAEACRPLPCAPRPGHRLTSNGRTRALHSRCPRPAEPNRRAATPPACAPAHQPITPAGTGSAAGPTGVPPPPAAAATTGTGAGLPLHDPLRTPMPDMGEVLREHGWMLEAPLEQLMAQAASLRDQRPRHANVVTFSPKVFLPLTRLCRDRCGYCTFVTQPRPGRRAYMTLDEVLQVAELGAAAGCSEALLTLGDRPELTWREEAGAELAELGYGSTLEYLEAAAQAVYSRTGLLPHINAGVMTEAEISRLKRVSASQGLMLESTCLDLLQPGAAHHDCSSKHPTARLATIEAAGRAGVPYTSGLLVGIGDSRADRLHALACLQRLHCKYGHIQELIIQNFVAKPGTPMGSAGAPSPPLSELQWAVAAARVMFGPDMNIQAPPNLTPLEGAEAEGGVGGAAEAEAALAAGWRGLLDAGINDWGGISPITRDFVNPDRPWPHLAPLAAATAAAGKLLLPRLPTYPAYLGLLATPAHAGSSNSDSNKNMAAHVASAGSAGAAVAPEPGDNGSSSGSGSSSGWLDFSGGSASIGAAVLRAADSSGWLRASEWVAGRPEAADGEAAAAASSPPSPTLQSDTATQPSQAVASAPASSPPGSSSSPPAPPSAMHQQRHQQPTATRPSVPPPRRPGPGGGWRVAVGEDGALVGFPAPREPSRPVTRLLEGVVEGGRPLQREEVELLLRSRGADHAAVCAAADLLRRRVCGDHVSYVVNRNINYTNVCTYKCSFCAFSKGKAAEGLRGPAYVVPLEEISRRTAEAWERGATEVCMQGGIHPDFTGDTYLRILAAAKEGAPRIHVHAFSPLEVAHGAASLGLSYERYLEKLAAAGLGSLPGTAAEVLDDAVRGVLCPDKLSTAEWGRVVAAAHAVGLRTTSTIMFGSVEEGPAAWAGHLMELRRLQQQAEQRAAGGGSGSSSSGGGGVGFTEFVPLPFVHMEAPIYLKGRSRRGPTLHEGLLLHAVARLALHPHIPNIQASWVKMGPGRAAQLLAAGCNDMGGSIMNETITRAAGASHGQELPPPRMEHIIRAAGRSARQRTTLYGVPPPEQTARSFAAAPLAPLVSAAPGSGVLR